MFIIPKRLAALAAAGMLLWSAAAPYQNGVYRDSAPGYGDDVIVTVTVRDGRITDLKAQNKQGGESEYFRKAEAGLRDAVIAAQGVQGVDAVTGATGTSQSILEAMQGLLEQMVYQGVRQDEGLLTTQGAPQSSAPPTTT